MKKPAELLDTLNRHDDTGSFIAVYKEAAGIIKLYKAVQAQAVELARSGLELDGVTHHKDELGSVGWTAPKTPRLNREKWGALVETSEELAGFQHRYDQAKKHLEQAQEEAGCLMPPEPRFYIR